MGGRLVACTSNGYIFVIGYGNTTCGNVTQLASVGTHLSGILVVPNNTARWSAMSGKVIAGGDTNGKLYAVGMDKNVTSWSVGANIEDLDWIDYNTNLFGVNLGVGKILGVDYNQWTSLAGGILATTAYPPAGTSGMFELYWDFTKNQPYTRQLLVDPKSPITPGQWQQVTYSPTGVSELLPAGFSLCTQALADGSPVGPFVNTVAINETVVQFYGYDTTKNSTTMINPAPQSNTALFFLVQDPINQFSLVTVIDKQADGSGGTLNLVINSVNIDPPLSVVQDDPAGKQNADFPDS
jgi:hypothetical protein